MSTTFSMHVYMDQASLDRLAQLADPTAALWPAMREAMTQSLDVLEFEAQQYMYATFENTTGQLEEAFVKYPGTFESELVNDEPYAQRRNYGFTGMTDALGRYYPWDGGIAWAETAVANSWESVLLIWETELGRI